MLFHASIEADHPRHTATVIAELWRGKALPFPPVGVESWVAFADDDRGTIIEVYPRGTAMHEAEGGVIGLAAEARRHNATHLAIASPLSIDAVLAIGAREGWPAAVCSREGKFRVIELWIDGCQLIEVLTAEMQREYLDFVTVENWESMLAEAPQMAA
ncbi:hypothetical protein SAMN06295912_11399 [Sphingomonas laterariae]|uniref:Uncharacterized protein n=1 Tax=Edaphosphingomonas laterariae TaxID=861865 RepID=A0A239GUP1_9SPHN|nr:hypothetical protein [Sphingomonas laterariae]SNS72595.1 hypothetical protein SAMN06295912_11399 [Sphingomonas laterariae]